jgi:hypothetical protein
MARRTFEWKSSDIMSHEALGIEESKLRTSGLSFHTSVRCGDSVIVMGFKVKLT